jgi:PAS domain S-box-containing protein
LDLLKSELTELLESDIQSPFRLAVDQAGHAIFFTNPNGEIQYVNNAFEELTGYSKKEIIGENPRILDSHKQDRDYFAKLWKHIKAGDIWEEKIINQRADSSHYTALQKISPLKKENEIIGFVAIQQDITEEIEVQKQLEKTVRKKTNLVKELHHRSRNNLQFITSLLNIQARNSDNESTKEELKKAQKRIHAIESIYKDYEEINNSTSLDLQAYLNRLGQNLISESVSSEQSFSFEVVTDDEILMDYEIAKHVGFIVNELLSASFKNEGSDLNDKLFLKISLERNPSSNIEMTISCKSSDLMNCDNFEDNNSLSLKLVENLVTHQLKGSMEIKKDDGIFVSIIFPLRDNTHTMVT